MARSAPHAWHGTPVPGGPRVVVGVHPGQEPAVVATAAGLAARLSASLVCVWADGSHVVVGHDADGGVRTVPLDPDAVDGDEPAAEVVLERALAATLGDGDGDGEGRRGAAVAWRFEYAVGEASHALAAAAREHDALLVVVGPRRPGLAGWMDRVVGGTVAGRLVHTQDRPVVVVPARGQAS